MKLESDAKVVTIYVNSSDHWHGKPLYSAIIHWCQEHGIAGATVSRCVEGYGAHHKLHTSRLLELSENLPVRIEIVDVPEILEPLWPVLEEMIGEGLVTVADVHVRRYLNASDPDKRAAP